jgi:2-oxoisovalerate dehydrogenase E1 component
VCTGQCIFVLKVNRIKSFREEQLGLDEKTDLETIFYSRLTLTGRLVGGEPDLSDEMMKKAYGDLIFARVLDEQLSKLSTFREIGTYAPYRGQEATQVGICMAMEPQDWYVPMYRDSMAVVMKGLPPEKVFLYWAGDERGMEIPEGVKMLPFSIPVGTHIPHGAGLALAEKLRRTGAAVLATTGDGGTSKGDFHEGLNFAGAYSLPLVTIIENNQYAISLPRSLQTASKTLAQKAIAYGMEGILVDGNDLIAVYEATQYALEKAREGGGPTLIEMYTYRMGLHTTAELVSHKLQPPEELERWEKRDPIKRFEKFLMDRNLLNEETKAKVEAEATAKVKQAIDMFRSISPPHPSEMFKYTYDSPTRWQLQQLREDFGDGFTYPHQKEQMEPSNSEGRPNVNIRNAINMALKQEMERDKRIIVFGEDVGKNGGVFQVTKGLQEQFGIERVFDTPLEELGIAGLFFGLGVGGLIPVAEFQFEGFTPPAYDQIFTHIARIRNRSRGRFVSRGVIRFPYGGGLHAPELHLDSPETYYVHTPGLKVVVPSNPFDAKGLFAAAVEEENPVIFMEPKKYYDTPRVNVPEERYTIPLGRAKVAKVGGDVTLVTYGAMLYPTLEAAERAAADGHTCDVIDLRTLSPMDFETVQSSVEKTGRLVIVHEAPRTLGLGAEIAARTADSALLHLKAPIKRVTGYDVVDPLSRLQQFYIPNAERILKAIREVLQF